MSNLFDEAGSVFDEAESKPQKELVTAGRYRIPNRDGTPHKGGWTRVTNLSSSLSDAYALRTWEIRQILMGMHARTDYMERLAATNVHDMEPAELRKFLDSLAKNCKEASKSDEGARRGTARHDMVEHWHGTGGELGTEQMRRQLSAYRQALTDHRLTPVPGMQEIVVIIPEMDAAGRVDNILWDELSGQQHIADLKTQKRWWTLLEVRCQLALYAHAEAIYDPTAGTFVDMPPVDQETGFALWMPRDSTDVQIMNIDLVKGWQTALRAREIMADRSEAGCVAALRGCVRTLPVPAEQAMATVEAFAARFRAATTVTDGRAIQDEAKRAGVWGDVLIGEARQAAARILAGQGA